MASRCWPCGLLADSVGCWHEDVLLASFAGCWLRYRAAADALRALLKAKQPA